MCRPRRPSAGALRRPSPAATTEEAVAQFEAAPASVVVLDLAAAKLDALALLERLTHLDREVPVIVLSGPQKTARVVQAMRLGAADFLAWPVGRARARGGARRRPAAAAALGEVARSGRRSARSRAHGSSGRSERMAEVCRLIDKVSDTDATVLDSRRERNRQGTGRARHPRPIAALATAVRQGQLRGAAEPSCSSRSCSASSGAPSPGPCSRSPGSSSSPTRGRCSSTRSARWARRCRPSCCRCCRTASSRASAARTDVRVDVRDHGGHQP